MPNAKSPRLGASAARGCGGHEHQEGGMNSLISRRDLLKGAAIAGMAVAATPAASFAPADVFVNLTAVEGDLLEAIVARLIPTDANGPGATEARAAHYIDRALG